MGAEELMDTVDLVNEKTIRKARARIDVVAMNLHRQLMRACELSDDPDMHLVDVWIFVDSSPQWGRGLQLLAITLDFAFGTNIIRRKCPLICIPGLDYAAKLVGTVWGLWLMVGPRLSTMKWFRGRVRACITDFGASKKVANAHCCFPAFTNQC